MKAEKYNLLKIFVIVGIFSLMIPLTSAFSVSYPYTKERPFIIGAGETGEFQIQLQSSSLDKTENIKIEILEGGDIISLDKDEYQVKPQEVVDVNIRANIPQGYQELTEYKALMKFSSVSSAENQGTLTFDKSYTIGFNVLVKTSEKPVIQEPVSNTIWLVLIIIILLAIVLVIYFYLKQKSSRKRK